MVNEAIVGGLRIAISHKYSLKDAMQSFYNAGYKKEEVEEAAKVVFEEQNKLKMSAQVADKDLSGKKPQKEISDKKQVKSEKDLSKRKIQIILIASGLIVLLIAIVGIIIFRDKLF